MSHNKGFNTILFIVLTANIFLFPFEMVHAVDTEKNVLILNSYHKGYPWSDNIIKGIESILAEEYAISTEYMDSKFKYNTFYMNKLYDLYKYKYQNSQFDVIITIDDEAYHFAKDSHKELFKDTPIVVGALNDYEGFLLHRPDGFTGIGETVALKQTIDLALKLDHSTENIFITMDNSLISEIIKQKINFLIKEYKDQVNLVILQNSKLDPLLRNLKNIPDKSAIIQLGLYLDSKGDLIPIEEINKAISEASNKPIYALFDMHLTRGVLGGNMAKSFVLGEASGRKALQLLKGASVNNIPFALASVNSYIFNHEEMRKFHIRKNMLPEGSIIINSPSTSIELPKNIIYFSVIAFITILALVNFILMINVSQRKTAVKSLKEEKNMLKSILDSTGDGILVVSKKTRKVLHVNKNFKKMWNIPENLFYLNNDIENIEFVMPQLKNPDNFGALLDETMLEGKERFDLLELKDGRTFERFFKPLIINDNVSGMIWSFRDITKKKAAEVMEKEIELQHKLLEEAHHYDVLRTQFFSMISHEFKTPLNIILGVIQLMTINHKNAAPCPYYDTTTKHMNMMKQNCYRLLKLINNLIDITRIDSGFLNVNLKNREIIAVIEDITLSVAEYAEYLGITLIFDTDIEERIMACDADKLERIMLNLLSNAMKFTEEGGTIEVNLYNKQDHIIVTVKDTGIGIPDDMNNIIFERFRQVDSSLMRKREGSGIGLSLVKMLVDAHGGSISVESELGIGSKFILKLPAIILEDEQSEEEAIIKNYKVNVEKIIIEFSDIYS